MKTLIKAVLFTVLSINSYNLSAQTDTFDMIERLIDSLGQKMEINHTLIKNNSPVLNENKEISIMESFGHVEVRGGVTVILTNGPSDRLWLKGSMHDMDIVQTTVKNKRLVINAEKKKGKSKLMVYIPVAGVSSLIIYGDAEIFSSNTILSRNLEITLNGNSLVSVKYLGSIKVLAGEGSELIDINDYKRDTDK